jgi:hypothetical protein
MRGDTNGPPVFQGVVESPTGLAVDEKRSVTVAVACASNVENEEMWTFRISASGESVAVNTTIAVEIACTGEHD